MAKFKKGDRVVVSAKNRSSFNPGVGIGTILVVDEDDSTCPYVNFENGTRAGVLSEVEAELCAAPVEAATALPEGLSVEIVRKFRVRLEAGDIYVVPDEDASGCVVTGDPDDTLDGYFIQRNRIPALIAALQAFA
ncbi:hypothetical protein RQ734_00010 [Roseomonas mucosa]|uniref:hypothetical protein n=1 Tax=Roseomonas mucosa TaxID=207340 RepID=UPI0028CD70E7|nr:hypothetical protein [Roseomonas mucosa]MDT8274427.1 hypothetical protein [Roseomonas mucosa]